MCGIAGIMYFTNQEVSKVRLQEMTRAIAHRGPDGEGLYIDHGVGLGHRRLAIIDLSTNASQPMISRDNNYIIAYNGEVYNFLELKRELTHLGYIFKSTSDTEVILYAYAAWGKDCVKRFNGMFAFAIWDKHKQELFLARDRYGIKPLYYLQDESRIMFGSEQKAILADSTVSRKMDFDAVLEYFTFQNIFTDKTFNTNIKMFPAGCCALVQKNRRKINFERYWDFNFQEPNKPLKDEEYIEELDRLFKQAVKRQLISDVDIGAYLSGGMDSGAITAIAAQSIPYLKTFTCGFDLHSASGLELAFDERERAEYMSYLFKTEHYEMVLKAGDMERILSKVVNHLEEPRVGQSYPNYYAAQLASKFVKVVLSGAGGDELFAGYPWRYYRAAVNDNFDDYVDKYYKFWQRLIPNKEVKAVFKPIWSEVKHVWTQDIFRDICLGNNNLELERPEDYINQSLYFEAKTFLHGLLVVEDKLSMANGIETRVPFLDNDLVDFAMKIPTHLKLRNLAEVIKINENEIGSKTNKYFNKTKDGKLILRRVMERYIPESVTQAVKQGFSAPDASWFKGESIDYVKNILRKEAVIYQYLDYNAVKTLVDEHLQGSQNRRLLIWSLINFELICEKS